jgi:amino acid transporter
VEVFALAFGTMVGWGWSILPGAWIEDAGVLGAVIAFSIGGFMCILVGLTYAELTSAFPLAGGELAFSYRGMGYLGSWITGWTISFAYIGIAAWEAIALSSAFHHMFPLSRAGYLWNVAGFDVYFSWSSVGIVGAVILTLLNMTGVKIVAVFQILLVLVMVTTGIIFVLGGLTFGQPEYMTPVITDMKGIGMVLLVAPSMYLGFDMISKSAEEMNMPLGAIAGVLIVSIVGAGAWYILMIVSSALSAPPAFRHDAFVPAADAAAYAFESPIMAKVILAGGVCGIITSWNGFIVGASRILFAMGRAKMLPGVFGWAHPKYQTPVFSILFVGLICCLSPLLGENVLTGILNVAAFGTVIVYLLISISFLRIRKKEPGLRRRYSIKRGRTVGVGAAAIAVFFLFWYTPFSPSSLQWPYEWALVLAWAAVGIFFLGISEIAGRKKRITEAERELLMFGEEYAREAVIKG